MGALLIKPTAHVVDVLGNVIGRDQPILRMEKALEMVAEFGEDIFLDDEVVFFDPFCKAGELLLACAFHRCWAKVKGKSQLLDMDMVFKEIYQSNRYFGLAPDERHHRLSMRTFLGNTYSHDEDFNHIIRDGHYVSEKDGKLNQEKFEKEFNSMINYIKTNTKAKRIVAIGNPPYQEEDGGAQKSARPIYNLFVEKLINEDLIDEFLLVIPSRWFGGGKGLDDFRELMMASTNLKNIKHFGKSGDVFPTVDIDGGVCFIRWDKNWNGKTTFTTEGLDVVLDNEKFDIIPDDPGAYSILEKIRSGWEGKNVADVAWTGKPFGLRTFWFERNANYDSSKSDSVPCLHRNRQVGHIKKNKIPKNGDKINLWKVCIPNAYGGKKGDRRITLPPNQIFLLNSGCIATETYNVVNAFQTKKEAEHFIEYLKTDFVRYLLGLRKITQHIPRERWMWVPLLDTSKEKYNDEKLFTKFGLSKSEQLHIKKKVQEWS